MIGSQSAPGCRLTVTKSLTPKMLATPGAEKTASAKGFPPASAALLKLIVSGRVMSSPKRRAFGFGLGEGVAVAMTPPALHARAKFFARKWLSHSHFGAKNIQWGG